MIPSPFHDRSKWLLENDVAFAVFDGFPVSPGHALVLPKRQVVSLFDLEHGAYRDVWSLVWRVRHELAAGFFESRIPDGFNIGVNDGEAAGQSVAHAHIHIIPRYSGDHPKPRGGVRAVIPEKADY